MATRRKAPGAAGPSGEPAGEVAPEMVLNRPFVLSHDELISYIREGAAEQASAAARERLNFFFTLIGIVVGLVAGAAAGVFFMIQASLDKTADAAAKVRVDALRDEIAAQIEARFATLSTEAERKFVALREENGKALDGTVDSILLLSLIGAEANSLATDPRGSRPVDRARMVDMLADRHDEIAALDGQTKTLAMRRIEDMASSFFSTGDYFHTFRLYEIFGEDLFGVDGALHTYALLLTENILSSPDFLADRRALVDSVLARNIERRNYPLGDSVATLRIVKAGIERNLDAPAIAALIEAEDEAAPGFTDVFASYMASAHDRFANAPMVLSPHGRDKVRVFREAARMAGKGAAPVQPSP